MGLFWDLLQQSQISEQRKQAEKLKTRVAALEAELLHTRKLLRDGQDIGGDGWIGQA